MELFIAGSFVFHAGEKVAHLKELRPGFEGLEAGIGQHLKEPGTAEVVGGCQFGEGNIGLAEDEIDGRGKGSEQEALAAEPLQSFENGAGLVGAAGTGQCVGENFIGEIEVGEALGKSLRSFNCAIRFAVVCQYLPPATQTGRCQSGNCKELISPTRLFLQDE